MRVFGRKPPWYVTGLAFECQGCGCCCAGPAEGYVWVTAAEIERIAGHLGISETEMRNKYVRRVGRRFSLREAKPANDCIFLAGDAPDGRACRVYAARPRQCRAWPFWPANLRSPDTWAQAAARCPGINRGRLFSREQIEDMANGAFG